MAVETPARHLYVGDGGTRLYPIPTYIRGDDYIRIEIDGVHQSDRTLWDIVNNSIIFTTAPDDGVEVSVQVVTSEEGLSQLGSTTSMDIVAADIGNVNTVGTNIDSIKTVDSLSQEITSLYNDKATLDSLYADKSKLDSIFNDKSKLDSLYADKSKLDSLYNDKSKLDSLFNDKVTLDSLYADKTTLDSLYNDKATLDSLYADKTTLDTLYDNISGLTDIYNNLPEILEADTNATIATNKAIEATTQAARAESYADNMVTPVKVASSVLLNKDSLALDNSVITKSNANITYTGNGTTQDIVTGISSVDFTVASNGSGFYHDRSAGDCIVKNDAGTVIESGSCVVNTSKVHLKNRTTSAPHWVYDSLRGTDGILDTSATSAEGVLSGTLTFNTDGITVLGNSIGNNSVDNFILHQTLYTHIKWGLTSQGKRYITAYNPVTREVMTMYQGSGVAGHQIPNPLGVKLDYWESKELTNSTAWYAYNQDDTYLILNTPDAYGTHIGGNKRENAYTEFNTTTAYNSDGSASIMYGFANSETKIITQYTGTGAAGNFVETKDVNGVAKKPRRIIIKRTDSTGNWTLYDSERGITSGNDPLLILNNSDAESTGFDFGYLNPNGFTHNNNHIYHNASGGQYIAIVEFDTTGSNDDTYFDLPTDDTNLTLVNGKLVFTDGRASNGGYNVSTQDFTGSVDFTGISDGIKYVGLDKLGNVVAYDDVSIGLYDKESADDNRLTFDTESGKWHTTTGGELVTNGTFDTDVSGWTGYYYGTPYVIDNSLLSNIDNSLVVSSASGKIHALAETSFNTIIGEEYVVVYDINSYTTNFNAILSDDTALNDSRNVIASYTNQTSTGTRVTVFTAISTTTYILLQNGSEGIADVLKVDNITAYKYQATLGAQLTTPICFLDEFPYFIASGTPQDRLEDYPSIPKNVMEDTYVDGDLEASGYIKGSTINISTLPTADPFIDGELWNSSNTIKLSVGA